VAWRRLKTVAVGSQFGSQILETSPVFEWAKTASIPGLNQTSSVSGKVLTYRDLAYLLRRKLLLANAGIVM
jgi:hypothetical protein